MNLASLDFRQMLKYLGLGILGLFGIGVALVLGVGVVILFEVYLGDVSELKKSTIMARINEETTIYTLDDQTKLGTFFESAHRSYVPIDQIPDHMIRAMVASEDKNFFDHVGIDPVAIAKAFFEGIGSGFHFKRGASSITQQTVKNIMDRREHSFRRKFKEMVRALQLERMYSKEQILEFYLNQFHVTANGNGIGIAAQYYFNKDVRDLNLVEAAFIAGSVKAPSKYNPFMKYTREEREKAWEEADQRKNYVLRRMYEQGWVSKTELEKAWKERVPFKRGKFRTREVALVSLIRNQLNKKEILEALNVESADDLNHAGLKVFTTIDSEMQEEAQLMMRRNLSRLTMVLSDYKPELKENFKTLNTLEPGQFYFGKVTKIERGAQASVSIDYGLPKGNLSYDALVRAAKNLDIPMYKGVPWQINDNLLKKIHVGDIVFTEVKEYDEKTHMAEVELRRYPSVNGGLIAVDKGEVRAVVAGFDGQGFNRAMFATRQPGSVFKSVVYFAGLHLGWTILDSLDNERRLFPFQGKFYFPRGDHVSPYKRVSMLWAGVKSENLASVYLTDHLVDKLKFEQFRELMGSMDLLPHEGESERDFHYRVAKETGVQLDNDGIREYLLEKAVESIKPDLIFAGRTHHYENLSKMWWGRGYAAELKSVYASNFEDAGESEKGIRIRLLKNNYERLMALGQQEEEDWNKIANFVKERGAESIFTDESMRQILTRFRVLTSTGALPSLGYERAVAGEDPSREGGLESLGRPLNPLDVQAVFGGAGMFGSRANLTQNDVVLSGFVPWGDLKKVKQALDDRYAQVMAKEEPFNIYRYFNHHDFRIILGLKYLVQLSKAMGVYSHLEPVLSFPLGTNDVSVAEVAKLYGVFSNGMTYKFYKDGPANQLNFIRRIEDRDGNVLFQPKRMEIQLVDPCYGAQMTEILKNVVIHGTGRRARGELYVTLGDKPDDEKAPKIRVPAFGKTGTTNDYRTAYFAGFLPYPHDKAAPLDPALNSLVIASYVGYDFNRSMQRGGFRISGAYGALPAWTDFAKAVIKDKKYVDFVDQSDLNLIARQSWPVKVSSCTAPVKVDLPRGAIVGGGGAEGEVFHYTNFDKEGETFENEFAQNVSLQSIVNVAMAGGKKVLRAFQTFRPENKDLTGVKAIESDSESADEPTAAPSPTTATPATPENAGAGATPAQPGNAPAAAPQAAPAATTPAPTPAAPQAGGIEPAPKGEGDTKVQDEPPPLNKQKEEEPAYIEDQLW